MNISDLAGNMDASKIPVIGSRGDYGAPEVKDPSGNKLNFNLIKDFFNNVNDSQIKSEQTVQKFASGEIDSIHKVMIDTQEALLSLRLAGTIRNKAVEAYQEVMRMQI